MREMYTADREEVIESKGENLRAEQTGMRGRRERGGMRDRELGLLKGDDGSRRMTPVQGTADLPWSLGKGVRVGPKGLCLCALPSTRRKQGRKHGSGQVCGCHVLT